MLGCVVYQWPVGSSCPYSLGLKPVLACVSLKTVHPEVRTQPI